MYVVLIVAVTLYSVCVTEEAAFSVLLFISASTDSLLSSAHAHTPPIHTHHKHDIKYIYIYIEESQSTYQIIYIEEEQSHGYCRDWEQASVEASW